MTLAGGIGTGTGNGGNINFNIAKPSGSSSSTPNTLAASPVESLSGVNGAATFENSANSTTAFQIQNASGVPELAVDTSGNKTTLGHIGTSNALQGTLVLSDGSTDNFGATIQTTGSLTGSSTFQLSVTSANGTYQICTTLSVCSGYSGGSGTAIVEAPASTAQNTINPGATSGVVALTARGGSSGSPDIIDVMDSGNTKQDYFNSAGSLNVNQLIQPTANNTIDLGVSGTAFRTGYFGTSVQTPLLDTPSGTTTLAVGATSGGNATAINLNQSTSVAAGKNLSLASGTGTFSQTYTGTSTDAHTITANSLTTGTGLKVTTSNNTAANTSWSAIQFDPTNAQGTTAVSGTNLISGFDEEFTQAATVAGNNETVANFAIAANSGSPADQTVNSIINLANNDTATGNQITATDGLQVNGANVTNGIYFNGTFGTNLISSSTNNFSVSQAGAIVGVGVNSGMGLLQGTGGLTLTGTTQINATTAGTTTIGNTTAGAIQLASGGASSFTVTGSTLALGGTNFNLATTGVITMLGGTGGDITTAAGATANGLVFQPGNTTTATSTGAGMTIQGGNDSGATAATGGLLTLKGGNATTGTTTTGGGVTIDSGSGTTAGGAVAIGGSNAASVALGRTGITTQVNGTAQLGGSAGSGALINNGSTTNTVDALGNFTSSGSISATPTTTVDIYTYISIAETSTGISLTIPSPTASTAYGKLLYISNIGTQPFGLLSSNLNPGSTATLVWANASGGAAWTFAGADANGLQSAYNNSGTTNPQIVLSNTNGGIKVQDASSSTITYLLQISNNGGTSNYLTVTSAASGTLGTSNITLYATSAGNGSRTISIANQTTAGQIGDTLNVIAAAGNTSGAGGALNVTAGAGGNAAGGGAVTVSGGAAGGGNNGGGVATLQGGAATGTGTGGTTNVDGGAASSTAGSAGGAVSIASGAGATGSGATGGAASGAVTINSANAGAGGGTSSPGGSAGNVTITAGNGGTSTNAAANGSGGSIFLVAGNAGTNGSGTAGTPGVVSIDSPVFTSVAASASGSSYAIPQGDIDNYGTVVITESTSGGTVTVAAPTNNSTGHVIYMMASNGSLSFTLSPSGGPSVNMDPDDTEMLEWNGSQWTASVSGSSLQQVYNNTTTAPASIVTTSNTKTILLQAGSGDDASNLFAVDNGLGSAALDVDTTAGVNLIQNSSFETNPLPGSGAGAWTKVGNASASVARSTTYAYVGSASLQLNTTNNSGDGVEQAITTSTGTATALTASTQYYISWYANGAGTAVPSTIAEYAYNGSTFSACTGLNITSGAIPSSTGWTRYSCTFTTGSGGTAPTTSNAIEIIQNSAPGGTRTWYIDAVQLEQNATGPTAFRETALQLNGLITSPVAIQSANNSVSALSVQNASGSSLLVADTLDGAVGINMGAQAMVNGGGDLQFGGSANRTIEVESAVAANANGGNLTLAAGQANGTGTGGTLNLNGGTASSTAGSAGGGVAVSGQTGAASSSATAAGAGGALTVTSGSGGNDSSSGAGGAGGNLTLAAGNGGSSTSGTNGGGGSIFLVAGNAGGTSSGTPGVVSIDSPVFTSIAASASGSSYAIPQPDIDGYGTVVITESTSGGTVTVAAPTNNSTGHVIYMMASNGSTSFTLSPSGGPSVNMNPDDTEMLEWNGSQWTASVSGSSLQQVYNNTTSSPASILTTSSTKTILIQAGVGDDSSTLFSVDNSYGSSALDVDSTTVNLIQNSSFEESPLPGSGAGAWTKVGNASASVARSTAQAYLGSASLQLNTTNNSGDGAEQTLTNTAGTGTALTASTTYYLSWYANGAGTAVSNTVGEYAYNGSTFSACTNLSITNGAIPASTGWTRYTCTFTTGSGGTAPTTSNAIEIIQNAAPGGTRTWYIDAVELETAGSLAQTDAYAEANLQFTGNVVSPLSIQNATNSTTAFQIQNAGGTQMLDVDTLDSLVVIGTSTNNETFGSTGEPTLAGTARHAKTIQLTAEYAGAVLDTGGQTSVTGIMTAAFDSTHDIGYYNWTTSQGTAQTYDIVARVPIPSDWSSWNGNPTFLTQANVGTTTGVSLTVESISYEVNSNPTGTPTTDATFGTYTITPSSANTWTAFSGNALASSGYAVGDTMIIRIRLSALSNDSVEMGDITIPYLSKY